MAVEGMLGSASFSSTALSAGSSWSPLFMLSWSCWRRCTSALRFSKSFWLKGRPGRVANISLALGMVRSTRARWWPAEQATLLALATSCQGPAIPEPSQVLMCHLLWHQDVTHPWPLGKGRVQLVGAAASGEFLPSVIIQSLQRIQSQLILFNHPPNQIFN